MVQNNTNLNVHTVAQLIALKKKYERAKQRRKDAKKKADEADSEVG